MAYAEAEDRREIEWSPPGLPGGVVIRRRIGGQWYEWRVPYNGLVNHAMTADLLNVTTMTISNWTRGRGGTLRSIKLPGHPSAIPLSEVKRVRKILLKQRRLGGGPPGQ